MRRPICRATRRAEGRPRLLVRLLCVLLGRAKELSDMHGRCSLFMLETLREILRVEHDPACEAVYAELRRSVFDAVCTAWTAETGV